MSLRDNVAYYNTEGDFFTRILFWHFFDKNFITKLNEKFKTAYFMGYKTDFGIKVKT